jgi:hypothetical protein
MFSDPILIAENRSQILPQSFVLQVIAEFFPLLGFIPKYVLIRSMYSRRLCTSLNSYYAQSALSLQIYASYYLPVCTVYTWVSARGIPPRASGVQGDDYSAPMYTFTHNPMSSSHSQPPSSKIFRYFDNHHS